MDDLKEVIMQAIYRKADGAPRSQQVEVGPSEIGGKCKRRLWLRLHGGEQCNFSTEGLAAEMGTAWHSYMDEALHGIDPWQERYLREQEFTRDGLRGHVDLFDTEQGIVVDYKTTTLKRIPNSITGQYRTQVHLYGWLISQQHQVNEVALMFFPRDGKFTDVAYVSEPYDEAVALEALAELERVRALPVAPEPGERAYFCSSYCPFFGSTCPGGA